MKTIVVLSMLVAVALALPQDTYSTKYDNFNAQELVENVRLLKSYGKCFLDKGPCTPEGTDFKKVVPDALKHQCQKCSEKQKELIRLVIHGFQDKLPELWKQLVEKEDPKGEYADALAEFLKA